MRSVWLAVGVLYLVDAIWSWAIGLTLSDYTSSLIVICVLLGVTALLRWKQRNPGLAAATEAWALWMAFAIAANLLTYLAATPALPLRDELFAGLDRDIGFHWMDFYNFLQAHRGVNRLLSICYGSLIPETLVLSVFLSFAGLDRQTRDFFWIAYIAILLTGVVSSVVPAAGAFPHYGLSDKADWLHDLEALRSGSGLHFVLPEMVGLVTFPSFHATLLLLIIYITCGTGLTGYLFTLWNLIMLVSIAPLGGHYMVDLLGGAGVLVIAVITRGWVTRLRLQSIGRRPMHEKRVLAVN